MRIRICLFSLAVGSALVMLGTLILSMSVLADELVSSSSIFVTTTVDELVTDGNCSLREAIQAVNTNSAVDSCGPSGLETIELPSGVYSLTLAGPDEDDNATGDLDFKGNVTVQGVGGTDPVIDGNQLDRVLQVHAGASVTITAVVIRNGRSPDGAVGNPGGDGADGGAISNAGTLTLIGCDIHHNRSGNGGSYDDQVNGGDGGNGGGGGGIFNAGLLNLDHCAVRDNNTGWGGSSLFGNRRSRAGYGGGIYTTGTLVVASSSIHGNGTATGGYFIDPPGASGGQGAPGGGIYNDGMLTIKDSTISDNRTGNGDSGGGTHGLGGDGGHGGGIYNAAALDLGNSTISGNSTGEGGWALIAGSGDGGDGGGIFSSGMLTAVNGTIVGNFTGGFAASLSGGHAGSGGGIAGVGAVQLRNTILAGNRSDYDGPDCSGTLTSAGYNLVQEVIGCTIVGNTTGNIVGESPRLLPLADNGGPTWTHALTPGPAVDGGSCTGFGVVVITLDQRGFLRPQGVTCDIGAYEAPVFPKVFLPAVMGG